MYSPLKKKMIVKSVKAEGVGSAKRRDENPVGAGDSLKSGPVHSGEPTATANRWRGPRKPGSSWLNVVVPKLPLARENNVSEYQDHFKAWPVLAVHRRKPADCIRLKGDIDLLTNYANVYRGVRGEVAKLARHRVTMGTDGSPFDSFSAYQDTYKAWSVPPAKPHKPVEYMAQGDVEFVTDYAREYKAYKVQKRLPIIHLEQTAMPVGPFQKITSYRHDFACKTTAKRPPGRPTGGETVLLSRPTGGETVLLTRPTGGETVPLTGRRPAGTETHRAPNPRSERG